MSSEIMQETTPLVECSAFHLGMSVLEASLRNTEDSDAIISGLLKGAAEFYGASRASVVEADWDLGIGVITYEWCKDGVPAQRDMLQCLPMEKFPRWRKALRANKPVVISDLQRLEKVYPDEAAFFREYGVTTLLAAPFSKRINQGFIAVDDPTRYTDDPVFLFIASYAVVVELNEIKQQQSLLAATKASKYNPEDIHINFFGGMEIISSKGTLTGEDIKADQCYLLLAYLILNHKKNFTVDTLAEIICPYDELDSPYKVVNNIVYRLRRTLSVIGLDKLVIGKNGTFQINPNFNIHTDFDRFEDACIVSIQLFANVLYMTVNDPIFDLQILRPQSVKQHLPSKNLSLIFKHKPKKRKLFAGQNNLVPALIYMESINIHTQLFISKQGLILIFHSPTAKNSRNLAQQDFGRKGLWNVIVNLLFKTPQLVFFIRKRSKHNNRNL